MSSKRKFSPANFLLSIGSILILVALIIVVFTFFPVAKEEVAYDVRQVTSQSTRQVSITPVDTSFGIVIEKIGANAKVIANVDPFNSKEYQAALSHGVAHAKGSALPGQKGNVFLFSHSSVDFWQATRYNSVFYLLDKLQPGDQILVYYQNQKYIYQMTNKLIVEPSDISYLSRTSTQNTLTLMTCWPPGTSLKRLILLARLETPS